MSTKNGENYPSDGPSAAKGTEWAEAAAIDAKFEKILQEAQSCGDRTPMTTEESILAGKAAMTLAEASAARTLMERIAPHELITEEEFAIRLGVGREWIADALADHRLFLFSGPDEVKYFPAFYGDDNRPARARGSVCAFGEPDKRFQVPFLHQQVDVLASQHAARCDQGRADIESAHDCRRVRKLLTEFSSRNRGESRTKAEMPHLT